ncbi:hypothetical protein N7478_000064 [Penicillium angulare]|uniref:uncharacterized protein n=1 Tax=Penicillium angulare TaxID=116970 RepID=UPI00253F98AB|nr:uncharacterized protein N7478_000064 [Penicillium angulare]KAJ5290813.1 hypothetical protein N7478_000064 [Penicillium angulare]
MAPKKFFSTKKQNGFSDSGYSPALRSFIEKLKLPDEITCAICHQIYPQGHYSKGQLLSLCRAFYSQGDTVLIDQRFAKCSTCCCAAVVESKCRFCSHWKGIDNFARTQRTLEQPACKKCQDYYQESAFALDLPAPTEKNLIEAGDEPKTRLLLPSNEDGSSHEHSNNETLAESNSDANGLGDIDDEGSIPPIVTLIGAGETESPVTRLVPLATMPAKTPRFLKVRPTRPTLSEVTIAPPEQPHDDESEDECAADMDTWRYL